MQGFITQARSEWKKEICHCVHDRNIYSGGSQPQGDIRSALFHLMSSRIFLKKEIVLPNI